MGSKGKIEGFRPVVYKDLVPETQEGQEEKAEVGGLAQHKELVGTGGARKEDRLPLSKAAIQEERRHLRCRESTQPGFPLLEMH